MLSFCVLVCYIVGGIILNSIVKLSSRVWGLYVCLLFLLSSWVVLDWIVALTNWRIL